jgi:hypothetical protein
VAATTVSADIRVRVRLGAAGRRWDATWTGSFFLAVYRVS